jgi:hypothetical protein
MTKRVPAATQLVGQRFPVGHGQDRAEVAHRHLVAIDFVGRRIAAFIGRQVGDHLVAMEVEVDPFVGAAAFGAAEQVAIKAARLGNVADRESEVERNALGGRGHGRSRSRELEYAPL